MLSLILLLVGCVGPPDRTRDSAGLDSGGNMGVCPGETAVPIESVDFLTGAPSPGTAVTFFVSWVAAGNPQGIEVTHAQTDDAGLGIAPLDGCSLFDWQATGSDGSVISGAALATDEAQSTQTISTVPSGGREAWLEALGLDVDIADGVFVGRTVDEDGQPESGMTIGAWKLVDNWAEWFDCDIYYFSAGGPNIAATATDADGLWLAVSPISEGAVIVFYSESGAGVALSGLSGVGVVTVREGLFRGYEPDPDCDDCYQYQE